jgi:hypothetical protein
MTKDERKLKVNAPIIFLSYARKDSANVKQLYCNLNQAGYRPWMDIEDILPGKDWEKNIIKAINSTAIFIACLSKNSFDRRGMIQVELKEALLVWRQKLDEDIYLIPVRFEICDVPDSLKKFQWVDLFEKNGFQNLLSAIRIQTERLGLFQKLKLRASAISNLSQTAVFKMIKSRGFYDEHNHWKGVGIKHQYELVKTRNGKFIIDHTTSLCWQQSGSIKSLTFKDAGKYIGQLNDKKYAGFSDWRLPTIEEALSLMEPKRSENGLYINSIFNKNQQQIWTSDKFDPSFAWIVHFFSGFTVLNYLVRDEHIRAVRSNRNS